MAKGKKTGPHNAGKSTKVFDHRRDGKKVKTKGPVKSK